MNVVIIAMAMEKRRGLVFPLPLALSLWRFIVSAEQPGTMTMPVAPARMVLLPLPHVLLTELLTLPYP